MDSDAGNNNRSTNTVKLSTLLKLLSLVLSGVE